MLQLLNLLPILLMPNPGVHRPLIPWPPPPPEHVPIFITGYSWDPEVDSYGCDSDCGYTALGIPTSDSLFGLVAACPRNWLGWTIHIDGVGSFWCIDQFGDPVNRELKWEPGWGWVYHVDLALEDPWSAPYGLHYGYSIEWLDQSHLLN